VESRQTLNRKGELMLDLIARKSQQSFDGFIETLQQCYHEHVVQELMGPEVAAKIQAKVRASEEVDVQRLEHEIRENISQSFEHNNTEIKELVRVFSSNGITMSNVSHCSIVITLRCRDYKALESLQELYSSKELEKLFTEAFCPKFTNKGLESLRVLIPEKEFDQCCELRLMTREHHEALESSAEWLMDKVKVSEDLLNRLSLCELRKEAVKEAGTQEEQVKTLLDIVSRQPDSAFTQLIKALDDTQQHEAASNLHAFEIKPSSSKKRNRPTLLERSVANMIVCAICKENFKSPRSLPCLHTFCFMCLQGHCKDKLPGDNVQCPYCRADFTIPPTGVEGFVHNFYLQELSVHYNLPHRQGNGAHNVMPQDTGLMPELKQDAGDESPPAVEKDVPKLQKRGKCNTVLFS